LPCAGSGSGYSLKGNSRSKRSLTTQMLSTKKVCSLSIVSFEDIYQQGHRCGSWLRVFGTAGEVDEAIGAYNRLLSIDPTDAPALFHLASIYQDDRDNVEMAENYLEMAVESDPTHVPVNHAAPIAHLTLVAMILLLLQRVLMMMRG
jgi:tetratricopeptide (TPR) repeat protein